MSIHTHLFVISPPYVLSHSKGSRQSAYLLLMTTGAGTHHSVCMQRNVALFCLKGRQQLANYFWFRYAHQLSTLPNWLLIVCIYLLSGRTRSNVQLWQWQYLDLAWRPRFGGDRSNKDSLGFTSNSSKSLCGSRAFHISALDAIVVAVDPQVSHG